MTQQIVDNSTESPKNTERRIMLCLNPLGGCFILPEQQNLRKISEPCSLQHYSQKKDVYATQVPACERTRKVMGFIITVGYSVFKQQQCVWIWKTLSLSKVDTEKSTLHDT